MKINNIIAVAALIIVSCAATQAGPAEKHNPVPDNVKKLYSFLGNWKGKATMTQNGQTQNFDYLTEMKTDADGWGILYHEKGLIANAAPYVGFGMMGFDENENMLHIFTVSNYGDVHDHKGSWTGNKNFTVAYNGILEGKPMKEELSVDFVSADNWKFTDVVTVNGQDFQTLSADMHKVK